MTLSDVTPNDLHKTLEKIRTESYTQIPSSLILEILKFELIFQDDREKANFMVSKALEEYLAKIT